MRYLVAIGALLLVITGLAGVKYKQISTLIKFGQAAQAMGPPPEAISTAVAKQDNWEGTVAAVGTLSPARGVTISTEVPGVVKAIKFESGAMVRAGQVLVELDSSVERSQLASLEARRALAETQVGRSRKLAEKSAITRAQLDNDEASLKTVAADSSALRAQIARKVIRAPFAGRLGIRAVNLGQYLNPGTPITVLESLGSVYADFALPQQQLGDAPVGTPVRVSIAGAAADGSVYQGKIAAVDPTIDSGTRTVRLRAAIENKGDKLRPGMFVNIEVVLPQRKAQVTVPATAVVHAPYGDSVFVVEEKKDGSGSPVRGPDGQPAKVARQQFVRVGATRGDFVAIEQGITSGQEVVAAGAFKLRNGSPVAINNSMGATPSLQPRPENR